ncbi:MAG: type IV secretion system protein TraC [Desulfovibrio sp.]|uniref:type IV secretion system protein TraC n=1 Tax=Desulfovibrio sp. TaxID=885 RepID=UPI00135DC5F2|nr:type IV secretion system protein TraC [Desulfovibrio sp.]MTJ94347.1 type IV secretion system protein TraC [Desulfovibrio sp.]
MSMMGENLNKSRAWERLCLVAEEDKIFVNSDGTIGFAFLCHPLYGISEATEKQLMTTIRQEWPDDAVVQIMLYGTPAINSNVNTIRRITVRNEDPVLKELIEKRISLFQEATNAPLDPRLPVYVRTVNLCISAKWKINGSVPSEEELEEAQTLRSRLKQALVTTKIYPVQDYPDGLDQEGLTTVYNTIVNHGRNAAWRTGLPIDIDEETPIREKIFDYDTPVKIDDAKIMLGDTEVRVLSPKYLPKRAHFGAAWAFIGDRIDGARGLRVPFIITATMFFEKRQTIRSQVERKAVLATNAAFGPLARIIPTLGERKQDFDSVLQNVNDGDRIVKFGISVALFCTDSKVADMAEAEIETFWGENGMHMLPDQKFICPIFFGMLPLNADAQIFDVVRRVKTMTVKQMLPVVPVFAEWAGTQTPSMSYISRNGQMMGFCLFDSDTNYNFVVIAESGAGKSFFVNNMIVSYLAQQAVVWVLDVGRSYVKLCETLGGDFIEFGNDNIPGMNPFPLVEEWDEEEDMLVGLFLIMAFQKDEPTDVQLQGLKQHLKDTFTEFGKETNVDLVAANLAKDSDPEVARMSRQLHSFTSRGAYGAYFNGPNTVRFTNRFTVLELEELKTRKHLQRVVLAQMIYQIQQTMYLGDRGLMKLALIDEAWDLLGKSSGPEAAYFIETAFRRARKYRGAIGVITQQANDLTQDSVGQAVLANAATKFLLKQGGQSIATLRENDKLGFGSESAYDLLLNVHTVSGVYSEIFIVSNRGCGVARLVVSEYEKLLYSTRPSDLIAVQEKTKQGLTYNEAIVAILEERNSGSEDAMVSTLELKSLLKHGVTVDQAIRTLTRKARAA